MQMEGLPVGPGAEGAGRAAVWAKVISAGWVRSGGSSTHTLLSTQQSWQTTKGASCSLTPWPLAVAVNLSWDWGASQHHPPHPTPSTLQARPGARSGGQGQGGSHETRCLPRRGPRSIRHRLPDHTRQQCGPHSTYAHVLSPAAGGGRQYRAAHGKTPITSATEPALTSGSDSGAGTEATLMTSAGSDNSDGTLFLAVFPKILGQ